MLEIQIKEMSDDTIEVVITDGKNEFVIKKLSEAECLDLSTLFMDAAEDLLRLVSPEVQDILGSSNPDKSGNMIN
jgi:hypothetical protein